MEFTVLVALLTVGLFAIMLSGAAMMKVAQWMRSKAEGDGGSAGARANVGRRNVPGSKSD